MSSNYREEWLNVTAKYSMLKEVYILCEETDPELKTNLQPMNEFRAALDHVMKINNALYEKNDDDECKKQFEKLNSHIERAFFDVCDMASINLRNMIIDNLEKYDSSVISEVLPDYYKKTKSEIEEIRHRIVGYRKDKGQYEPVDLLISYKKDIDRLREINEEINLKSGGLRELQDRVKKEKRRENRPGIIIGIIGIAIGTIIGVLGLIF